MARVRKATAAAEAKDVVAEAAAEDIVQKPPHQQSRNPKPYSIEPRFGRNFDRVVELVFDESVDVEAEYVELERALDIEQALSAQVVKEELSKAEKRAFRAHRLYVTAKLELERYEIDVGVAVGAMRERAVIELSKEKDDGARKKQITEQDVTDRCVTLFPDEWRQVQNDRERSKRTVELLGKLSELWFKRSYSLSAMLGGNRT